MRLISLNPFMYARFHKEIRRALTKELYYAVFYRINKTNKTVEVLALRSQSKSLDWLNNV